MGLNAFFKATVMSEKTNYIEIYSENIFKKHCVETSRVQSHHVTKYWWLDTGMGPLPSYPCSQACQLHQIHHCGKQDAGLNGSLVQLSRALLRSFSSAGSYFASICIANWLAERGGEMEIDSLSLPKWHSLSKGGKKLLWLLPFYGPIQKAEHMPFLC